MGGAKALGRGIRRGNRGHKLLTEELKRKLPKLGSTDGRAKESPVIVKFFSPYSGWTWYAIEGEEQENGDWLFFGLVKGQLGYFALSELENAYRGALPLVERDCWFDSKPLGEFM